MILMKFDDDDDKLSCVISDLLCNESGARAAITITERGITWEPEDIDHRDYDEDDDGHDGHDDDHNDHDHNHHDIKLLVQHYMRSGGHWSHVMFLTTTTMMIWWWK